MDNSSDLNSPSDLEKALEKVFRLESELVAIHERNRRVEGDKAWETSFCRKSLVASITYLTTAIVFWLLQSPFPMRDALIPATGYLLSTLTIPIVKQWWLERN